MKVKSAMNREDIWSWIDKSFSPRVCDSLRDLCSNGSGSIASCLPDALLSERRELSREYETFLTATFDSNKIFAEHDEIACVTNSVGGVVDSSWVEDTFGIETRREFELLSHARPGQSDIARLQLAVEAQRQVVNKRYSSFLSAPFDSDKLFTALDYENKISPTGGTTEDH